MDEDRAKGIDAKVSGSLKEAIGIVTGDAGTKAEGRAEKAAGKAQTRRGDADEAIRGALDD